MADVIRCALDRETATVTSDERNRGTFALRFNVYTDGLMSPRTVLNRSLIVGPHPIPSLWASYSYLGDTWPHSFARQHHCARDARHLNRYTIDVHYTPLEPGQRSAATTGNVDPLLRPPVVHWDSEVYTHLTDRDNQGRPILNKCGRQYPAFLEIEQTRGVLEVEWNVANLASVITNNRKFEMAMNSDEWDVFGDGSLKVPARAALCRSVASQQQITEGAQVYYTESYRIAIKGSGFGQTAEVEPTWEEFLREEGFAYWKKDASGAYLKEPQDPDNPTAPRNNKLFKDENADEPVLLKADGTKLPDGGQAVFTPWPVRRQAAFNDLPFMPLYKT